MNSNYRNPNQLNNFNFDFDLGIGSNQPKSLNDQKNPNPKSSYSYSSSSSSSSYSSAQPRPAWQPNKPSWTHQPAPNLAAQPGLPTGPTSMVGDIFGKTWGSTQSSASSSTIGVVNNKNPNLFGDLVSSALGNNNSKSSGNTPLKNSTPVSKVSSGTTTSSSSNKSSFSMGSMADSLPKTGNTMQSSSVNWGSTVSNNNNNNSMNINKSSNLGGPSMRSMNTGGSSGIGVNVNNKDPFSSLGGFGSSKQSASVNPAGKSAKSSNNAEDDGFGDFQNASKPSSTADNISFTGSTNVSQNPVQTSSAGGDPMDMFFSSTMGSSASANVASEGFGGKPTSEIDDWGLDSEFGGGGHDVGGTTTELEGLPPPPAGVSGPSAKGKGMDNYKQGQFADAIKWLSWAVILLEKAGDNAGTSEVLSCRASCYKEVGEYKKAVADCTKVLENDDTNVSILVQRALLYESMEKYRLGAEDLRTVLKIDPGNRVARSTVHRLTKMAD